MGCAWHLHVVYPDWTDPSLGEASMTVSRRKGMTNRFVARDGVLVHGQTAWPRREREGKGRGWHMQVSSPDAWADGSFTDAFNRIQPKRKLGLFVTVVIIMSGLRS